MNEYDIVLSCLKTGAVRKAAGDIIINMVPGKPGIPGGVGVPGGTSKPGIPGGTTGGSAGVVQQPLPPQGGIPQSGQSELGKLSPEEINNIQMSGRDLPMSNKEQERVDSFTHGATPAVKVEDNTPNSGNIPITQTTSINKAFSPDTVSPAGIKDSIGVSDTYTDVDTSMGRHVPGDDMQYLLQELNSDKQTNISLAEDKGIDMRDLKDKVNELVETLGSPLSPLQVQGLIERTINQTGSTDEALRVITQILENRK